VVEGPPSSAHLVDRSPDPGRRSARLQRSEGQVFEIVIQTGAMLAILWEYRARFTGVLLGLGSDPKARALWSI
jgi:undecaprenyl pyrophosphate phosphatase UppP